MHIDGASSNIFTATLEYTCPTATMASTYLPLECMLSSLWKILKGFVFFKTECFLFPSTRLVVSTFDGCPMQEPTFLSGYHPATELPQDFPL